MPEPLLDHAMLEKLERLAIHWKKSLPGLVGGHNTSRFAGPGQEFLDHRHFHHGDDLRAVNWRVYLRLEKLFLKMFQLEPRIPVRMLVDTSRSMLTGADGSKFDYARKLAGALCYVGLVRLDSICLQPFSDKLADAFIASGGRHRFQPALNFLSALRAGGQTDFLEVAREFISTYPQQGLVIVISDFLDDGDCEKPLQYLSDFGHELILIQVFDPSDREPPWEGELDLEDAETGQHVELAFDSDARAEYTAAFDEYAQAIRRVALRNNGRYVSLPTNVPVDEAIFGPLVRSGAVE
ncbi:MAG TPA: DUF58 domain-containing protein [Bryobacteraceae bacterium]|nr:DUF58 domain-containing protein [Bryobacteraceae bacterium]